MKKRIVSSLMGLALLGAASSALAVPPNVYTVVFDGVTHSGGPMGGTDYLTPADPTGFTADFSLSKTLQFNFLAPEGKEFVFNAAGPTFATAVFRIGQGQETWGSVISAGFLGLKGEAPTIVGETSGIMPGGVDFGINASAPTSFSFTGFSATVQIPDGDSDQFLNVTPEVLTFQFASMFGDPGQQVTLQSSSVPEPSTMALAGLAGLSLRLYRRRK